MGTERWSCLGQASWDVLRVVWDGWGALLCSVPDLALLNGTGLKKWSSSLAHRLRETDSLGMCMCMSKLPKCRLGADHQTHLFLGDTCHFIMKVLRAGTGFCFVLWTPRASCQLTVTSNNELRVGKLPLCWLTPSIYLQTRSTEKSSTTYAPCTILCSISMGQAPHRGGTQSPSLPTETLQSKKHNKSSGNFHRHSLSVSACAEPIKVKIYRKFPKSDWMWWGGRLRMQGWYWLHSAGETLRTC